MKKRAQLATLIALGWVALAATPTYGLNEQTHRVINVEAARRSQTDSLLKGLGFSEGLKTIFRNDQGKAETVEDWMGQGGIQEDQGNLLNLLFGTARYTRHFHDPLQPWDTAGLRIGPLQFESSLRWMQDPSQATYAVGGNWAWQDTRQHYYQALTSSDSGTREQEFADTFRALGQLMHLVTDASVPEHTRNDIHPFRGLYGNYEYWVSDQHGRSGSAEEAAFIADFLSSPFGPDPAILQQGTGDTLAPVPVARLIDTDTYQGLATGPNITLGRAIGIAEVANANFFSEDTGSGQYPYPNVATLQRIDLPSPTGRIRAYFAKDPNDGLDVGVVLAECVLYQPAANEGVVVPSAVQNCTDEVVWANVADQMLPRAVGYSAALLDYFFRGSLEAQPGTIGWDEITGDQIWAFRITNKTQEVMVGSLELYYETPDGTRRVLTSWPLSLEAGEERQGFRIPRPALDAALDGYLLVFRGQLGTETEAVVGARTGLPYIVFMDYTSTGLSDTIIWLPLAGDAWQGFFGVSGEEDADIGKDDYGRVAYQSGFGAFWIDYRSLYLLPGDVATLDVGGYCLTFIRSYWWTGRDDQYIYSPVTGEIVELEEPRDWAALLAYGPSQFAIKRVLYSYSGMNIVTLDIEIGRGRFFGVRVTRPSPPELKPDEWVGYTDCHLGAGFRNLR